MPIKVTGCKHHNVEGVKAAAVSSPARIWSPDEPLVAAKISALFAAARRLRADALAGVWAKALRGRNLALLLTTSAAGEKSPLHRAAEELGVRVAEVRFETDASRQADIGTLARVLERLYDAVDCDSLPLSTVQKIQTQTCIPVYAGLGTDDHPARALADLMALCEHGAQPGPQTTIVLRGDPQMPRNSTFLSAARELGFTLQVAEAGQPASNDATYVVDAMHPPRWSLYAQGRLIDEGPRSESHRCLIQTVLLDTIARA